MPGSFSFQSPSWEQVPREMTREWSVPKIRRGNFSGGLRWSPKDMADKEEIPILGVKVLITKRQRTVCKGAQEKAGELNKNILSFLNLHC